jgi:hypothetical protein
MPVKTGADSPKKQSLNTCSFCDKLKQVTALTATYRVRKLEGLTISNGGKLVFVARSSTFTAFLASTSRLKSFKSKPTEDAYYMVSMAILWIYLSCYCQIRIVSGHIASTSPKLAIFNYTSANQISSTPREDIILSYNPQRCLYTATTIDRTLQTA